MTNKTIRKISKGIVIICLGLIFPLYSMCLASIGINTLTKNLTYNIKLNDLSDNLIKLKGIITNGNDYSLYSLLYTEHANQKTMINKQIMKSTIIQTGFAAISIGIMLILLGINDGGINSKSTTSSFEFNLKTGSSGIAIFLLGSIMILTGSLKNEYKTVPIPKFAFILSQDKYDKTIRAYNECRKNTDDEFLICFASKFEEINYSELQ